MGLIDDLLDVQAPENVQISPNGQRVIYTTSATSRPQHTDSSVSTIWLAQMGQEKSAHQITSGKYNDTDLEWSPDGESIAFISDREKPGETSAIYILPMEVGGEPYALTAPDNERDIEEFHWSPDGKFIAYISADEKTPEQKQREKDKDDANVWDEDLVLFRLRLLHVRTRKITTLVASSEHVTGLAWSPDGTRIAFLHTKKPGIESEYLHGCSISVIEVGTKSIRPVQHFGSMITDPTWVGNSLFFTGSAAPPFLASSEVLWSVDLESENPQFQRRAHGDVDCAGDFVQAGQHIVMGAKHGVGEYIHILDGKTLQTYNGDISSFDVKLTPDSGEMVLAVVKSSVGAPSEVYSTTVSSGVDVQLSSHGDVLEGYEFGTSTVLECLSTDNEVRLNAIYFSPARPRGKNGSKGPFPTAVLCHGGPYGRSTDSFDPSETSWLPVLLEAGYGVLAPNYRGSSGRGDQFAAYARGRVGTVDYDDVITLTQHAIETGYADKDYLLIGGWSQGGTMSYLASVRNGSHGLGWRFRAAIPGAGVSDQDTMCFTSDLGMTFELEFAGTVPWDSLVDATGSRSRSSAIWSFKKAVDQGGVVPPMLILHGEEDERVPFEQAVAVRRALQYHKLPFEFVSYPREGHEIVERMHVKDRIERVLRWADTYLSPL